MSFVDEPHMRDALSRPFDPEQIGKLPATAKRPALDYVGHAVVTARLNRHSPDWTYHIEPVEVRGRMVVDGKERRFVPDEKGLPHVVAVFGTMTVGGVTRQEVGEVDSFTTYGDEMKKAISDFIRRGAMRFGVALDLWSKEDLETSEGVGSTANARSSEPAPSDQARSSEPDGELGEASGSGERDEVPDRGSPGSPEPESTPAGASSTPRCTDRIHLGGWSEKKEDGGDLVSGYLRCEVCGTIWSKRKVSELAEQGALA